MRNASILTKSLSVLFLAAALARGQGPLQSKTETFDRDPKWDGRNNWAPDRKPAKVHEDFGYSRTRHARGKAPGEIGGRVVRSSRNAFYAKRLERVMTLDDPLCCTGQFVVTQTGGTSSLVLGWFNSQTVTSGTYVANALRLRFNGESRGCEVFVDYTTSQNQSDGVRVTGFGPRGQKARDFNLIPINTVYTFDLRYDPRGNDGNGQIVITLGGDGPYTAKDLVVNLRPEYRKAGARFDRFGITNLKAEPGGTLAVFFDDLALNGETLAFDDDPGWVGQNNRATFDDAFKRGVHDFGYQPNTQFAGGKPGEIGGVIFCDNAGYYGDDVGRLTLDDPLVASGRLAVTERGSEAGFYLGWFNANERGFPPKNLLGAFIEGPNSVGSMFRPRYATSDPKIGSAAKVGPVVSPFGKRYTWEIRYDPRAAGGNGEVKVTLGDQTAVLALAPGARRQNALFDRFGVAVYEGGGQWHTFYLDDLRYTSGSRSPR